MNDAESMPFVGRMVIHSSKLSAQHRLVGGDHHTGSGNRCGTGAHVGIPLWIACLHDRHRNCDVLPHDIGTDCRRSPVRGIFIVGFHTGTVNLSRVCQLRIPQPAVAAGVIATGASDAL
jgi:hypothetical protein